MNQQVEMMAAESGDDEAGTLVSVQMSHNQM
jgi:hypothetical protein